MTASQPEKQSPMTKRVASAWLVLPVFLWALLAVLLTGCASLDSPGPDAVRQDTGLAGVMAASEVLVGENRFPFGVATSDGQLVEGANVHVRFYKLTQESEELKIEEDATFREVTGFTPHRHEDGQIHMHKEAQGVYVVDRVTFDEPGIWRAELYVETPGASTSQQGSLAFQVTERSATFRVGDRVPLSRNPTARDAEHLTYITTHHPPVPELYKLTVEEALAQGAPFVVAFSTPAFCASRMCGPVTDVVAQLSTRYDGRASFIHIEPWKLDVARTQGRLELTDIAREWKLPSEPWVFVVDREGRVSARFEGLVSAEELAAALEAALR